MLGFPQARCSKAERIIPDLGDPSGLDVQSRTLRVRDTFVDCVLQVGYAVDRQLRTFGKILGLLPLQAIGDVSVASIDNAFEFRLFERANLFLEMLFLVVQMILLRRSKFPLVQLFANAFQGNLGVANVNTMLLVVANALTFDIPHVSCKAIGDAVIDFGDDVRNGTADTFGVVADGVIQIRVGANTIDRRNVPEGLALADGVVYRIHAESVCVCNAWEINKCHILEDS